jgi:hypothetical protein
VILKLGLDPERQTIEPVGLGGSGGLIGPLVSRQEPKPGELAEPGSTVVIFVPTGQDAGL